MSQEQKNITSSLAPGHQAASIKGCGREASPADTTKPAVNHSESNKPADVLANDNRLVGEASQALSQWEWIVPTLLITINPLWPCLWKELGVVVSRPFHPSPQRGSLPWSHLLRHKKCHAEDQKNCVFSTQSASVCVCKGTEKGLSA